MGWRQGELCWNTNNNLGYNHIESLKDAATKNKDLHKADVFHCNTCFWRQTDPHQKLLRSAAQSAKPENEKRCQTAWKIGLRLVTCPPHITYIIHHHDSVHAIFDFIFLPVKSFFCVNVWMCSNTQHEALRHFGLGEVSVSIIKVETDYREGFSCGAFWHLGL